LDIVVPFDLDLVLTEPGDAVQKRAEPDPGAPLFSLLVPHCHKVAGLSVAAEQREWCRLKERSFPEMQELESILIRPASHNGGGASLPRPTEGQHSGNKRDSQGSGESNLFHDVVLTLTLLLQEGIHDSNGTDKIMTRLFQGQLFAENARNCG
jgi:hypothetical protein